MTIYCVIQRKLADPAEEIQANDLKLINYVKVVLNGTQSIEKQEKALEDIRIYCEDIVLAMGIYYISFV